MRELGVYIETHQVGTLNEGNGIWRFDYKPAWAAGADSFDLSPALPRSELTHLDGSTLRPVQWYFDNLLPEEGLRVAAAKDADIKDAQDAFALLTYLGAESAGSLTLLPPGKPLPEDRELRALPDEELSRRISNLPRDTLTKTAPKRMSVAGAQHKLLAVLIGEALYEPVDATPSTYILKPDHPHAETYPASAFNEYITMRMAKAARMSVPKVDLRYVPQPVYLIERFDRVVGRRTPGTRSGPVKPPPIQRLHVIDACQLLNKDRLFKHPGATLDSLAAIIDLTTNKLATRLALFRWLVFNVVVANDDSHLKNLSFHVDHEGVRLAPHYDLLSTGTYHTKAIADESGKWAAVPMTFALPGAKNFGDVTYGSVVEAGKALGLPLPIIQRITGDVVSRVETEFERIVQEHHAQSKKPTAERGPYLAIEQRLLLVMQHITLKDMLQRLRPSGTHRTVEAA